MILEQNCVIPASITDVWPLLLDLERVAPCLPGGQITERIDDRTYKATMHVRLGPVSMKYNGVITIAEADAARRRTVMDATAKEAKGQGTAQARITTTLVEADGITNAVVVTDLAMTGRAASMGRGIIGDVAERMMGQFAANLAQEAQSSSAPDGTAVASGGTTETADGRAAAGALAAAPAAAPAPTAEAAPMPINGFRLMASVLLGRIRRLFGGRG
jgi:carbon monoxide dehydrogenase subunit G